MGKQNISWKIPQKVGEDFPPAFCHHQFSRHELRTPPTSTSQEQQLYRHSFPSQNCLGVLNHVEKR